MARAWVVLLLVGCALVSAACATEVGGQRSSVPAAAARATDLARSVPLRWPTPGPARLWALLHDGAGVVSPPRTVTADEPLRVHVAGDSFAQPVANDLERIGAETGLVTVDLDFQLGSGVTRSDYFDWPARIVATYASAQPEVLVFNTGGNDPQPMWTPTGWIPMGTPDWQREYARRSADIMDTYRGQGVRVYWVGMPVLRDPENNQVARLINGAVLAEANRRPWVRFIDVWPLFVDAWGAYTDLLPDPDGGMTLVRQEDGVHLTNAGSQWVSDLLYEAIRADWGLPETP